MKRPRRTFYVGAIVAASVIGLIVQSTLSANAEVAPSTSISFDGSEIDLDEGSLVEHEGAHEESSATAADFFTPEDLEELNAEWKAAQKAAGTVNPQAIPAVILGALKTCAAKAVDSGRQQEIEDLIEDGKSAVGAQRVYTAISGCVFGTATPAPDTAVGVGAACKASPPCATSVQAAVEMATQKIIDRLA